MPSPTQTASPTPAPTPANNRQKSRPKTPTAGLLQALGIVGFQRLEPVLVAALAEEAPLLLIGAHGTAKSLLVNRVAGALGLVHRHYNASLLAFDDLVGYPYPSQDRRTLEYIHTPATLWDAESVFFDEVSRCRPELQNKLFPVVYEKMVQGIPLPRLRFRRAAMNPPLGVDAFEDDEGGYVGSTPLDAALADRFAWVVRVPSLKDLSPEAQHLILTGAGDDVEEGSGLRLARAVDATRSLIPRLSERLNAPVAGYVRVLIQKLDALGTPVSPRRARQLVRNVLAVHAARRVLEGRGVDHEESALLALESGLPHPAHGVAVDGAGLLAAHRAAWSLAGLPADDPLALVLLEADPLERLALAVELGIDPLETSTILLDVLKDLEPWKQRALATALFPVVSERVALSAVAFDTLAQLAAPALAPPATHDVRYHPNQQQRWQDTLRALAALPPDEPASDTLHDLMMSLFDEAKPS